MKVWTFDPQSGGRRVPPGERTGIIERAEAYAKQQPWHQKFTLQLRFQGNFCYLSAREAGQEAHMPIGRLRYFRENEWSLAFYTYSNEKYMPCFIGGKDFGTIEECIEICSFYVI
jgi:hypothetical protein